MKLLNHKTPSKHLVSLPKSYLESEMYVELIDQLMSNHWKNLREFGGGYDRGKKRPRKPSK